MTQKERFRLGILFVAILIMALLQVIGIASGLPFMQLVAEPEVISENGFLQWAYELFEFESTGSMLIASGFGVFILLAVGNAFSAFTTWLSNAYQNIVGDRGFRLSGGQPQLLGLAHALYKKPELLISFARWALLRNALLGTHPALRQSPPIR